MFGGKKKKAKWEVVSQRPGREMGDRVEQQVFESWKTSGLGELQIRRATRKEGGIQIYLGSGAHLTQRLVLEILQ